MEQPAGGQADTSAQKIPPFHPQRMLPYVLPMVVFLILGQMEPAPSSDTNDTGGFSQTMAYPLAYGLRIFLTVVAAVICWPAIGQFRARVHPLSFVWGLAGGLLWIGLCRLQLETWLAEQLSFSAIGGRAAFNPWDSFADSIPWLSLFLVVRFTGLVLVVPLIEEVFLRGFLLRFVTEEKWWTQPVGHLSRASLAAVLIYGVLSHPGEFVAAAVWFPLVSCWVAKTKSFWDAVLVHAVTNLTLGIYVVCWQDWALW